MEKAGEALEGVTSGDAASGVSATNGCGCGAADAAAGSRAAATSTCRRKGRKLTSASEMVGSSARDACMGWWGWDAAAAAAASSSSVSSHSSAPW